MKKTNIVLFGGGSGLSKVMEGLSIYPVSLTAIVSVADNGGSTGIISKAYNTPAFGDVRKVLSSVTNTKPILKKIIEYRFCAENKPFYGHTIGNIIMLGLYQMNNNDYKKTVSDMRKILDIKQKVIPVSLDKVALEATYLDGSHILGETEISLYNEKIISLATSYKAINNDALDAISKADMIIYAPGSLYTSLIASLSYKEIIAQIEKSNALKVYVANIMTEKYETINYKLSDHIKALINVVGEKNIDYVLANNNFNVFPKILKKYDLNGSKMVEIDEEECKKLNVFIDCKDLISIEENHIRHNHIKSALYLFRYAIEMEM